MDIEQTFYDTNNTTINGLISPNHYDIKNNGYHNGYDIENDTSHIYHNYRANGHNTDEFLIKIQNDYIQIENVTPELIVKMNKQEKQIYIDKCRQLYTAMIE
jgi:hypothetical protein